MITGVRVEKAKWGGYTGGPMELEAKLGEY
jgi:hypothetical protein